LKLIGAGLPRTGTLSQKVALEILGLGPCYHMVTVLSDMDLVPRWRAAVEGDADWPGIFGEHQSSVDWPGSYFYRELIDAYPDAKVLLSVRDGDSWARSMRETIWGILYDDILIRDVSNARAKLDPKWRAYIELMKEMWGRSGLMPGGIETTPEAMGEAMERFNAEVRQSVPADRLLVWSVTEGWEPLCRFLEVPVPETPFPHLNDSREFRERVIDMSLIALQQWRTLEQHQPVGT
jgi:Sulfotransferase domain